MRIPQQSRISARGGLLVVALMMTMLAGIFLAGWVALSNARAMQARNSEYAMKRRLALENSRAYIRQVAQEHAFTGNSTLAPLTTGDVGPGYGGLYTDTGWTDLELYGLPPDAVSYPATGYYTKLFPFNAFGLRPSACFASTQKFTRPSAYTGVTYDSIDPFNGYVFLKGIFPSFAGDAFVVYRKPVGAPGEINIYNFQVGNTLATAPGRFVVRDPASFYDSATVDLGVKKVFDVRAKKFYIQKYDPLNPMMARSISTGGEMYSANIPAAPSTFGPSSGATTTTELFRGDLNIIKNTYVPPGLPATVTHHPNCLWEIQNREALKAVSPVPVQTISVGTPVGTSSDPYWIADEVADPTIAPPGFPRGYETSFKVLHIQLNHSDLPNLRVYPVVNQVIFHGQTTNAQFTAARDMTPRIVLFVPDPSVFGTFKDVRFVGENSRPFVLGTKAQLVGEAIEFYWMPPNANGTPLTLDWRMIYINEGRQVSCFRPPGTGGTPDSVIVTGGFFTNWSIQRTLVGATEGAQDTAVANKFILLPEVLPMPATAASYYFASILPREAWLETFFQHASP